RRSLAMLLLSPEARAGDAGRRPRVRAEGPSIGVGGISGRSAAREVAGGRTRPTFTDGKNDWRVDTYRAEARSVGETGSFSTLPTTDSESRRLLNSRSA